jgi:hypothetical protein
MLRHLPRLTRAISHALYSEKLSREDLSWIQPYQPSLAAAWLFQRSMSMGVGQQQQAASGTSMHHSVISTPTGDTSEGEGMLPSAASNSQTAGVKAPVEAVPSSSGPHSADNKAGDAGGSGGSSTGYSWLQKLLLLPANHINELLGANFTVMSLLGLRVLKPFLQDTLQLVPLALTMMGMMLVKPLVITRVLWQVRVAAVADVAGSVQPYVLFGHKGTRAQVAVLLLRSSAAGTVVWCECVIVCVMILLEGGA